MNRVPVSVIVPTLNEELHIARCLESVSWAAERFVVDAFSDDLTVRLAESRGAQVWRHAWEGYSDQKNWALDNLPLQHEWVLFLDADERVSAELAAEIAGLLATEPPHDAYYVNRRYIFFGRWLKHAWWYPDRTVRLFRRRRGRFDSRPVHERVIVRGKVGYLRHDLIHENIKDLAAYLDRHNRYSTLDAIELFKLRRGERRADFRVSFRGDWGQRRRALKDRVWFRFPLLVRPLLRFVWLYGVRRGFLDGREGLLFSLLAAFHDFTIDAKYFELEYAARTGRPHPSLNEAHPALTSPAARPAHGENRMDKADE